MKDLSVATVIPMKIHEDVGRNTRGYPGSLSLTLARSNANSSASRSVLTE
jgi:hypothetical protein